MTCLWAYLVEGGRSGANPVPLVYVSELRGGTPSK
jgi:hypothetical protein